jgi:rRNA biogenesis protein RRP5
VAENLPKFISYTFDREVELYPHELYNSLIDTHNTMAPIKRKTGPTNDSFMRSKPSANHESRPSKRPRQEDSALIENDAQSTKTTFPKAPKISRVREEEIAFPRGGASVLTPLEHKQINIEATRDVLFEQQSTRTLETEGGNHGASIKSKATTKKGKSILKGKKNGEQIVTEEEGIKIEGLSYKVSFH